MQDARGLKDLHDQGTQASRGKDFASAEKAFRAGLDSATLTGEKPWIARFSQSLCELDAARSRFKEAVPECVRAIEVYDELSDKIGAARALDLVGQLESRLGRPEQAEAALTRAMTLYESSGELKGIAKVRGSLADHYSRRSDFRAALETGFRALDEDEKLEDRRETAKVLDVLGNTFQRMGQAENALRYYQRGLSIRQKFDLKQDLIFNYQNIGAALADLGRHAQALEYYNKSMELARAAGLPLEIVKSSINIGSSERALGHPERARLSFEEALAIAAQQGYLPQAATSLYALGDLSLASGDLDRALDFHQRALKIRREAGSRTDVVWSLNRLGIVLEDRGDLEGAEQTHARALDMFEKIGAGITDPVQYGAYRQTSVVLYPHYARVLVKLGKVAEALRISERSRGVGLARMTALSGANFVDLLSPEDARAWQSMTARRSRTSNALRVLEDHPAGAAFEDARSRDQARALFVQTEREFSGLRDRLFASTPRLRAAQTLTSPAAEQLEALAKNAPDTLFVEWMMVDGKSTLLFVLSASGIKAFQLDAGSGEIRDASDAWRLSLAHSIDDRGAARTQSVAGARDERQLAQKLYQLAFGKLEPMLAAGGYSRLVLVPEGPLLEVPFPALLDQNGIRLTERYAISNTVSFTYLLERTNRPKATRSLLCVADPIAPGQQRLVVPSGDRYGPLRAALAEAKQVAGMFPGSLTLAGPQAREAEIKRHIGEFELLHFATHGILDAADGLRSGLLLAAEPEDSPEDGVLEAWEIAGLSLSARLAVLSACETALGKEQLGDGLLGLAWAFQAAGVPRVVASLWNVDDAATSVLITYFYQEIGAGARVDDAMRNAILKMRKDPRYTSPYYWAAFEILGHAGTLQ
jgi:CHAT domain-containing protein/Tfp pilus assembly protein PilF